ncbi:AAA family ATPase [uncultured Nostoc sp.]|uniref:AAA family ATPase n=1 Tax=uncultured Nostoc sp. TaxID=340711 RepID=UPI0035C9E2E7
MRPLELTLEGFTSFRNQTKINFEKLEVFAITGPTGAGKSSLLDAMTLALYGKVARKTQPKELLSQGSLKLQVSLRFLVNQTEFLVFRSWLYRTKTSQPRAAASCQQKDCIFNKLPNSRINCCLLTQVEAITLSLGN